MIFFEIVAESVTEKCFVEGRLFPRLKDVRELSIKIAIQIAEECYRDGTAKLYPEPRDKDVFIRSQVYSVDYDDLLPRTYDWPVGDMRSVFFILNHYLIIYFSNIFLISLIIFFL
jgi:hypothetical protein